MVWATEDAGWYVGLQEAFGIGEEIGKVAIVFGLEYVSSHGSWGWYLREGQPEARGSVSDKFNLDNGNQIGMQSIQRRVTS